MRHIHILGPLVLLALLLISSDYALQPAYQLYIYIYAWGVFLYTAYLLLTKKALEEIHAPTPTIYMKKESITERES